MFGHGYFGGTRLQSVCTVPGCPALCEPGRSRCQDHARLSDRDGRAWRAQRELVLERDDHRCQAVLLGAHSAECGGGLQVHHIRDVQAGGGDELENLVTLCRSHNNAARRARSPRWLPALERHGQPALARSPATPAQMAQTQARPATPRRRQRRPPGRRRHPGRGRTPRPRAPSARWMSTWPPGRCPPQHPAPSQSSSLDKKLHETGGECGGLARERRGPADSAVHSL